jgi:mRNA interferase RelE/StbE
VTSRRYALEFAPKSLRSLRKLDRPVVECIKAATESLREDPRPAGAKMLTGMHGVLRIRVAGDYRVLYTIDDDRLMVLVVDAIELNATSIESGEVARVAGQDSWDSRAAATRGWSCQAGMVAM